MIPRQTKIDIRYQGKDIKKQIENYITTISYTDAASGSSDSLSINLHNVDKKWMSEWMPEKGEKIECSFEFLEEENKLKLKCGTFEIDDLSFSCTPLQCTIKASAMPQNDVFHSTVRTKTWENITIYEIAKEIASRTGIKLFYDAEKIPIENIEQNTTDSSFLYGICSDYGLAMKVYNQKICIFDIKKYEEKKPVTTYNATELIAWEYHTTTAGTYTGVEVKYYNPKKGQECNYRFGDGKRILKINVAADNQKDAERKGLAALHRENKQQDTLNITVLPNSLITASNCIQVTGLGKINGKYYVESVTTKVSGSGGTVMNVSARKIEYNKKRSSEAKEQKAFDYMVVSGDTLWALAKKYLGKATKCKEIYALNKEIIESTAKSRGKKDSKEGHWIFPGTILRIPEQEET